MLWNKKFFYLIGLAVCGVVLFLLFTLVRLPSNRLINATLSRLSKGGLQIQWEKLSPGFPSHLTLEGITIRGRFNDLPVSDTIRILKVSPDFGNLFKGHLPVKFSGFLEEGEFHGKTGTSMVRGTEDGYLQVQFKDISLERRKALKGFLEREVKGKLKGRLQIEGNLTDPTLMLGEGNFQVENGSIDTKMNLPGMKRVPFERIGLKISLKDSLIIFQNGELEGPMFSGVVTGKITLKKNLKMSQLDLAAKLKPGAMLEKNPLGKQLLKKISRDRKNVNITISGTLENPYISWRNN